VICDCICVGFIGANFCFYKSKLRILVPILPETAILFWILHFFFASVLTFSVEGLAFGKNPGAMVGISPEGKIELMGIHRLLDVKEGILPKA